MEAYAERTTGTFIEGDKVTNLTHLVVVLPPSSFTPTSSPLTPSLSHSILTPAASRSPPSLTSPPSIFCFSLLSPLVFLAGRLLTSSRSPPSLGIMGRPTLSLEPFKVIKTFSSRVLPCSVLASYLSLCRLLPTPPLLLALLVALHCSRPLLSSPRSRFASLPCSRSFGSTSW